MLERKIENVSVEKAQSIAKKEGAISAEEKTYDGETQISFYDKNGLSIAVYLQGEKKLIILGESDRKTEKERSKVSVDALQAMKQAYSMETQSLNKKVDDVSSLEEAKKIVKNKGLDVIDIIKRRDPPERFNFYDRHNTVVAAYFPEKKYVLYSESPPKYKYDTPEFQEFTRNLIRRRFPDRPGLLKTTVRRYTEGDMPKNVAGFAGGVHDYGAEIIIDRDFGVGEPNTKTVLTHELTHKRRSLDKGKVETEIDKEEIETELETIQRGGIVDNRYTDFAGYWNMLGPNWREKQRQDYRVLTGKDAPKSYDVLEKPVTDSIIGNINTRKTITNLWNIIKTGELKEKRGSRFRRESQKNPENIDTSYVTSEGDKYHFFSPSGKAKPRKIAKFIDRADGITGEEDIWQIMDVGKKLLISDKLTPNKIVKLHKKKPFGFVPKFKPLDMPTFNLPFMKVKKVKPKTQQKKKTKKSKDPIKDVLSFKFFK